MKVSLAGYKVASRSEVMESKGMLINRERASSRGKKEVRMSLRTCTYIQASIVCKYKSMYLTTFGCNLHTVTAPFYKCNCSKMSSSLPIYIGEVQVCISGMYNTSQLAQTRVHP